LRPVPPSQSQRAFETLKERIIKGEYAAQEVLSESMIARELGISRTPVREALARLEAEGWVQTLPGKGVIVRAPTLRDIHEMFDLRLALERHVIFELFRSNSFVDVSALRQICKDQEAALTRGDAWTFFALNGTFHRQLVALIDNRMMLSIMDDLRDKQMQSGYKALANRAKLSEALIEHHAIVDALERGDQDGALEAIEKHVRAAKRRLHGG